MTRLEILVLFIVKVCTIQYPDHIVPISLAEAPSAPLLVSANFLCVAGGDRCRVGGDWDDGWQQQLTIFVK